MAREERTFNSACYFFNAGFDFSATYSATDLLSTCYRYAVYRSEHTSIDSIPYDDVALCVSHVKCT